VKPAADHGLATRAQQPIWTPSRERARASQMTRFRERCAKTHALRLDDYDALHRWSIEHPDAFWSSLWDFVGVIGERGERVLEPCPTRPQSVRWFPDARLSFAENLLRGDGAREALVGLREGAERVSLTLDQLRGEVARWMRALRRGGVTVGTRVAGWVGNGVEPVIAMLATSALGGVWSSCSPDFGPRAVLDRFGPLEPRILVAIDGYRYAGKTFSCLERLGEIVAGLPTLAHTLVVPWIDGGEALPQGCIDLRAFLGDDAPETVPFERFAFDQPLAVVFSSGTTGKPKCIVHGAGSVLLQHSKEQRLHCDIRRDDRVFFHTTCGWMMWNWLVSALACEATLVLYDGSPLHPEDTLLRMAHEERLTFFGNSARYFDVLRREHVAPARMLSQLRTIASTGSPLAPETFESIYASFGADLHLASISGGTDILSCFVGGDPSRPVFAGEIQGPCLGMNLDVLDAQGESLRGAPGELICRPPFVGMPLGFLDDPDDARFRRAYFERIPGVWCHGDWAEFTRHGGVVIHGRSDATLNVHGVRIGTAEIYGELERFDEVLEAVAVECGGEQDAGIALFLRLRAGTTLDDALRARIVSALRRNRSPRHVPRHMRQVEDLPRTRSGKTSELAVRSALRGERPANVEALANPECLEAFRELDLEGERA